jgi:signal peptidase I
LTLGALLGLVGILLVVAGAVFGVRPLLFRSGSMAPTIDTGDLAIARSVPAADLRAGDIVSVVDAEGQRVTHRLVSAAGQGAARQLKLKGDANRTPDAEVYTVARADKVLFDLPRVGNVVSAATSRAGVFVLGLYVALLLFLVLGGRGGDPAPPGPRTGRPKARRKARRRRAGVASLTRTASVATAAGLLAWAGPASAAPWTDSVPLTGTTFAAGSLGTPTISCTGGGLLSSPTISWPTPSGSPPASYLITYANGANVQTATTTGNSWQLPSGVLSLLATYTINVQSVLHSWQSPASNTKQIQVTNVLFLGVAASCV